MRTIISGLVLWPAFLLLGCDSFRASYSLLNATTNTWEVSAKFSNADPVRYKHSPESQVAFTPKTAAEAPPDLSAINVHQLHEQTEFSITDEQMKTLRRVCNGKVPLVLFQSGLAAMSPEVRKAVARAVAKGRTMQDIRKLVLESEQACQQFTQEALRN